MKTSVTAVFAILACAGVWAQDSLDGDAADAPSPPPAARSIDLQATSLSVTLTAWNELLDDLQPFNSKHVDESMPMFVGDSAEIRVWINQQLQNHRAILDFDTRGRAANGQTWSFESESNNRSITIPKPDGSGVITGVITAPKFEITAWMSASEATNISVEYRPAGFQADTSEAHGSESAEPMFVGMTSPHTAGRSFVYWINRSQEPVSLLVVSVSDANESASDADEHDPVSISSNWPVPYTTTVPRSAAQSLPSIAEIVPGNEVDRESAPLVAQPEPAAGSPVDGYRPPPQPDVSTAGNYIQLTSGEAQTIRMHEHEARRIELNRRIASASGFNPDIVEVVSSGTDGLHIQSSRSGATKIRIVDEDGVPLELTVIVTEDMTDLELLLKRLYPEADVEVIPVRDTVLLRGTVDDAEQVEQIEEIAEQFAARVLNHLMSSNGAPTVEPREALTQIPDGFRVVSIEFTPAHASSIGDWRLLSPGDWVDVKVAISGFPTLINGAQVFALDSHDNTTPTTVSLVVMPDGVEALDLAKRATHVEGALLPHRIFLTYRDAPDAESPRAVVNAETVDKLKDEVENGPAPSDLSGLVIDSKPPHDSDSDLESLRDDIRALHEDVRRLIEVLEGRQSDETNANTSPATPAIDEGAAMLFFDASWCGPCQRMRPIVSRLRNDGFAIRIVDVDEERELSRKYEIRSIPSCVFLYDGREVERVIGMTTENELRNRLARASSPEYRSETESLGRVWTELGMQIEETAPDDERLSNSQYRGAVQITRVRGGSPAAAAGLRSGDLLVGLHQWETVSRENVEYVLDHAPSSTFSPLKFYVLRDGETLYGHFPHGERSSLDYPRLINHSVDTGILPIAATTGEAVDLLPLPAGSAETEADSGE